MIHYKFLWQLEGLLFERSDQLTAARSDKIPIEKIIRDSFTLHHPHGNSVFSRNATDLPVPAIIKGGPENIEHGENLAFVDSSEGIAERGLKNFIIGYTVNTGTPIFICDNHNYVLEAWQLLQGQQPTLIHIDQHRDNAPALHDETLYHTRICDYIDFAIIHKWIAEKFISIIESADLKQLSDIPIQNKICNVDLDIFAPECTVLSLEDKVNVITAAADNCSLITMATSPGFIAQPRAIEIARLLWKYL